ncbi:MAG: hypothetical protein JW993_16305 [Sedimentisphaerales bacterium]|nr:hypothetical protein [Sedimentisphaerales bacterium]
MKDERDDILERAIADLKQRGVSSEPPQAIVNETLAQLAQAQAQRAGAGSHATAGQTRPTRLVLWSATRLAAAAVVLVAAGYAFGRITAPKPDLDELRATLLPSLTASLEPAIRQRVSEEVMQEFRQAMVAGYIRMSDALTEQYRADLDRAAVQAFTASNTVTTQLLSELIDDFKTSRQQDRQLFASALEEIEARRAAENAALGTAVTRLASQTHTELQRTNEIVSYLANTRTDTSIPKQDTPDTMN